MTRSSKVREYIRGNVLGIVAIYLALGGISWAAALPGNSVWSKHIKNGQVKRADLARGAVSELKLADGSVVTAKLVDDAVTGGKIADNTVTGDDVAEASLDTVPGAQLAQRAQLADDATFLGGRPAHQYLNWDLTIEGDMGGSFGDQGGDRILFLDLQPQTVGASEIVGGSIGADHINPSQVQRRVSGSCPANQAATGITEAGQLVCAAASSTPAGVAGGDLTGSYPDPEIAPDAVGSGEVASNSLTGSDIDEGSLSFPGHIAGFQGDVAPTTLGLDWQFAGSPGAVFQGSSHQGRLTVTASASLWMTSAGSEPFDLSICQRPTSAPVGTSPSELAPGSSFTSTLQPSPTTHSASASAVVPPGTYAVGLCIRKSSVGVNLGVDGDGVSGWAMASR